MKETNESVAVKVAHERRGDNILIKGITGSIKIASQVTTNKKTKGLVKIEIAGSPIVHDCLAIKGSKGRIQIINRTPMLPCDLTVFIPAGNTLLQLEDVSGSISISEPLETLVVKTTRSCKLFAETLYNAAFDIDGKKAKEDAKKAAIAKHLDISEVNIDDAHIDINVKRMLGHCIIAARGDVTFETRDAAISTLSATLLDGAKLDIYGSARFASLSLGKHARCRINSVDILEYKKDQSAVANIGLINRRKTDENQRRDIVRKANAEIEAFTKNLLHPNATPPPLAANA